MLVIDRGDQADCTFAYDSDVVDGEWVQSLVRRFAQELRALARAVPSERPEEAETKQTEAAAPPVAAVNTEKHRPKLSPSVPPSERPTPRNSGPVKSAPNRAPFDVLVRTERAPASMQQLRILSFSRPGRVHEAFNQSWIGRRALHVRPGLDVSRMRRAVQAVIPRHESLRMSLSMKRTSGALSMRCTTICSSSKRSAHWMRPPLTL